MQMTAKNLAKLLAGASMAMERLACGESGEMHSDDTAATVAAMLVEMQDIVTLVEDESGTRFTRMSDDEIESMVGGWYERAGLVDARRGE